MVFQANFHRSCRLVLALANVELSFNLVRWWERTVHLNCVGIRFRLASTTHEGVALGQPVKAGLHCHVEAGTQEDFQVSIIFPPILGPFENFLLRLVLALWRNEAVFLNMRQFQLEDIRTSLICDLRCSGISQDGVHVKML